MSQLTDLYQELCLKCSDKNSLYYRITKLLMEKALNIPEEVNPHEEYLTLEEFVKRYPFCAAGSISHITRLSDKFFENCCRKQGDVITYCPYKVLNYIKDNQEHHYRYYKKIKRANYFGFNIN